MKHDDAWNLHCTELTAFVSVHHRYPLRRREAERFLARWVERQRAEVGRLSPERITMLEAIPGWSWEPREDLWEDQAGGWEAFLDRHGVPPRRGAVDPDERRRARWARDQVTAANAERMPPHRLGAARAAGLLPVSGQTRNRSRRSR